jgi:hypothetical protein
MENKVMVFDEEEAKARFRELADKGNKIAEAAEKELSKNDRGRKHHCPIDYFATDLTVDETQGAMKVLGRMMEMQGDASDVWTDTGRIFGLLRHLAKHKLLAEEEVNNVVEEENILELPTV